MWDSLWELQGIEKIFESVDDENQKTEILNFAAGLSEHLSKQIDAFEKKLTPQAARSAYEKIARELGRDGKEIKQTLEKLQETQVGVEQKIKEYAKVKSEQKEKTKPENKEE